MKRLTLLLLFFCHVSMAAPMLHPIDGPALSMEGLKGKWVMINYWATWCAPCLEEIPSLNRLYSEHKKDLAVFAVNYDMVPTDEQRSLSQHYHIAYPSLGENPAEALGLGDIRGVPITFVFNPQGTLAQTLRGKQSYKNLLNAIGK